MIDEHFGWYEAEGHPGVYKGDDDLAGAVLATEAGTGVRMEMRRQGEAKGPVGLLLEAMHLQAARVDRELAVHQWNQPIGTAHSL